MLNNLNNVIIIIMCGRGRYRVRLLNHVYYTYGLCVINYRIIEPFSFGGGGGGDEVVRRRKIGTVKGVMRAGQRVS